MLHKYTWHFKSKQEVRPVFISTDASSEISVRLVGGNSSSEGRVEVSYDGDWGTVCDDNWDHRDAMVVCRSVGYPFVRSIQVNFGEGTGQIYMDNLNCTGDEQTLMECHGLHWGKHNCDHSEDVGVVCSSKSGGIYQTGF